MPPDFRERETLHRGLALADADRPSDWAARGDLRGCIPITTGQRSGGAKRGSGSQANEGEDGSEEDEDAEYEYDDEYDVFTANFGGRIGQEGTQGDK